HRRILRRAHGHLRGLEGARSGRGRSPDGQAPHAAARCASHLDRAGAGRRRGSGKSIHSTGFRSLNMTATETPLAVRNKPDAQAPAPTVKEKAAQGIMARLGRWLERDRWPTPSDTLALFSARLTDVAANKLTKQWSLRYDQADS